MKKYTCLALLAFFGAATLSPVMALTASSDDTPPNSDGKEPDGKKNDKGPKEKASKKD